MINIMNKESVLPKEYSDSCSLDPQLWHACAGSIVQMPIVNSRVFYFPQGHIEHVALSNVDISTLFPKLPAALIPCRVSAIRYLAHPDTDEVYARIRLVPLLGNEFDREDDGGGFNKGCGNRNYRNGSGFGLYEEKQRPSAASFAKTLTQSDANNGGGFSVPRYCAETIFPRLDYSVEPPVQKILAKDVHGVTWKFRHIYRGTPRRHLLTTGWSNFVSHKKLVAGDSIVFLRAENGDLRVGVRRARRGIGAAGMENGAGGGGWNANCGSPPCGGYASFLRAVNGPSSSFSHGGGGSAMVDMLKGESAIDAARLAANGEPFEVVYYPRATTPEFCVNASAVRAAMQIPWSSGMRFKMAFETEDSSRISWFMGTVSSVQVADPFHWPNSPWRLLEVSWDEPDLLQNVKRVNPWLVEPVATMPVIPISPFYPPIKKLRLPQPPDFPFLDQLHPLPFIPPFSSSNTTRPSSPSCYVSNNISAGIQGARHAQVGQLLSNSNPCISKLQSGGVLLGAPRIISGHGFVSNKPRTNEDMSCLLTVGIHSRETSKKGGGDDDVVKVPKFMLFGTPILTEEQISKISCREATGNRATCDDEELEKTVIRNSDKEANGGLGDSPPEEALGGCRVGLGATDQLLGMERETGHCKVFKQSEDVGQTLDLSVFGSYEKLANMFDMERSDVLSNVVLYKDWTGATKHACR